MIEMSISFFVTVGMTASAFGLGATMSNFLGQIIVERMGHIASLSGSFLISFIPIALFTLFMPETRNTRGKNVSIPSDTEDSYATEYVMT